VFFQRDNVSEGNSTARFTCLRLEHASRKGAEGMSLFTEHAHEMKSILGKGNGVEGFFDFQSYYKELPPGEWTVRHDGDYTRHLWFSRPGHGSQSDYGNGSVAVTVSGAPDWLVNVLGIKKERRVGERRGGK
jgi:hypothetical protein